ncbi:MAG: DNA polymerase III subunit delta [Verrucomicrobiae bacterium]|nr:DNA polymerase III subunit delta [Verrucomicrobiae bacterium]
MPAAKTIHLIGGTDEFTVKETAARLARQLAPPNNPLATEIIEAESPNQDAALQTLARLRDALFAGSLFADAKLVWWKNTDLLADTPVTRAQAVKDSLTELADQLRQSLPPDTRLLISAIGLDKRRTLFKTLEKIAHVQIFDRPDPDKPQDQEAFTAFLRDRLKSEHKTMTAQAFDLFQKLVVSDFREMANELEKLVTYVGTRSEITEADVRAIVSPSRQAIIWDLTDALGHRRLPAAVAALEQLLEQGESPLGLLTMLVAQFRLMLLARDLAERRVLVPRDGPGGGLEYVRAFERLPAEATAHFPTGKDGALPNAWRLYRCALAAKHFTRDELIHALELLQQAYLELLSSQLDERLVLEETLAKLARPNATQLDLASSPTSR